MDGPLADTLLRAGRYPRRGAVSRDLRTLHKVGGLGSLSARSFPLFMGSFLTLFVLSGIGNGSTYQMIPAILRAEAIRATEHDGTFREPALALARPHAAALLVFLAGYLSCLVVTWWCYLRSEIPRYENRTTRTGQPLA